MGKQRRSREALRPSGKQQLAAAAGRRIWRWHALRLLATWGFILVAYSNSFQPTLVFDNSSVIGRDPRIRQAAPQNIASILTAGYRYDEPTDGLYRPLTTFSYMLNYAVLGNGPRAAGYHWVNLIAHELNVALVYALGILILGEAAPAWALAAIWGVHPLLTESVTNLVGRADLLAAFGILAGLLCHVRGASATGRRKLAWLAGVAAAQAVGLFSKESAAVLPGIMLLYDLTWPKRASWRARAPAYVALALPFAAYFYLRAHAATSMAITFAENPLGRAGFWTARLTAVKVMGKLLWLVLWPARLSADYSYNAVPLFGGQASTWENAKALLALAVCLGGAVLALLLIVRWRRAGKPMFFFLVFFFIAAAPTSNLIIRIGSIMAERFFYLPSAGLAGFMVAAALALGRRISLPLPTVRYLAGAVAGTLCLALAARTYARNSDWKDELSLWTSAVEVCPDDGKAHFNLGKTLEDLPGRRPDAIAQYRAAIEIDPEDALAHTNLGNALAAMPGGLPEAIAEFQAALRIAPNRVEPHNDLGIALAGMPGRLPDAIAEYKTALRLDPASANVHYNLADALAHTPGRLPEAVAEYQAALRIDPDYADAHLNLGNALVSLPGRLPDAIAEYRAALRIEPDLVWAHINLANALSLTRVGAPEAIAEYQAALRIDPGNADAHYDLGTVLANLPGRLPEAIAEFQAALRSNPDFIQAHVNLAKALATFPERRAEAIAEYEAALRLKPDPVVRQMADRLRGQR